MEALKFTLKATSVPVSITAEDGKTTEYQLQEMDAASRDHYLDQLSGRMRFDNEGKPAGVKRFEGMQSELLSACLFDSEAKRVPSTTIQKWPASLVSELFKRAQEMNHLVKDGEPPKNV